MGNYTVEVTCDEANGLGDLGIRISSIFVIGLGSLLGMKKPFNRIMFKSDSLFRSTAADMAYPNKTF